MNQYVENTVFNPPDPDKMEAALRDIHIMRPGIAIILLAYHAGMQSSEMLELKKSDINDDFSFIQASDGRKIPLTAELAEELKKLYWLNKGADTPVIYSRRYDRAMSRMNANRIVKEFMTMADMPTIRLADLRIACIVNWMQQYPWEYVSQISGVKLSVLTQRYQHYLPADTIRPKNEPMKVTKITPDLIQEIFQKHTNDLVGLILRLSITHRLNNLTLSNMTWDTVDFENREIRLPEKTIPISEDLLPCLEYAREYSKTNWVFSFPNTQTPYTSDFFSHLVKKTLLKDGYLGLTTIQLVRATEYLNYRDAVLNILEEKGRIVVADVCAAANLNANTVYSLLEHMQQAGEIHQIGYRFYSSKATVSPDNFMDVIKELDRQTDGAFTCREFAERIGIDHRSAGTQLRKFIEEGKVRKIKRETYAYIQDDEDPSK